jgi:hypothetical protein
MKVTVVEIFQNIFLLKNNSTPAASFFRAFTRAVPIAVA